ncbi:uncharacterized protein LOC116206740 isoform X2 [Punica granatum]|uniref:Uncharacterized protein LOC116206740 isoform X2 n=2 Tax=Punica granatum TaxID=22663 RepID=A0A6P8DLX0_PUNGR|nr:uncharacterized protein LOC116206740 isoform X2 [Punica granatum]PKI44765.1 hypothetical protein CRG98_034713 [Punica granatum]
MVKQFPATDAWMREAVEASQLIDDLETRIKNCSPDHLIGLKDSAKPKLLQLGVKLDRLESLLHNPPLKPILTETDIDLRWKLLSDIQLRMRVVALTLFAVRSTNRPEGLQNAADTEEIRRSRSIHDCDSMATTLSRDDPEMLKPLILPDATQSQTQIKECGSSMLKTCLRKACWTAGMILGAFALLFALFVLCTLV